MSVHQCVYVYKYVDQKGLAAIMSMKRSAVVTPEVNLMDPLQSGDEARKRGESTLALKPRIDVTRSPKTGVSTAPSEPNF